MSDELLNKILTKVISIEIDIKEKMATKDDLRDLESKMLNHIDGFIKLHETLDIEMVSLRNKYDRLEERVGRVETKLGLVTNS